MNKIELIEKISNKTNLDKKAVAQILESFEDVVVDALGKGEEVTLTGLERFWRNLGQLEAE